MGKRRKHHHFIALSIGSLLSAASRGHQSQQSIVALLYLFNSTIIDASAAGN